MKIAYIGYDLSCHKASCFFEQAGCEVVYFLKQKTQSFKFPAFDDLDILIDHLTVPGQRNMRSAAHERAFRVVKDEYLELKQNLSPSAPREPVTYSEPNAKIVDLSLLHDIQYDGKQKKIFIELEKKGVETFDYVFVEAHPLVAEALLEKQIKVFRQPQEVQYIWSSVSFEIDYLTPIEPLRNGKTFFVVQDPLRKSLIDNWFLCDFQSSSKLHVWGYMPYRQIANPEFRNFYIERVRKLIADKFNFIHLKENLTSQLSTVGALEDSVSMALKQTDSVPNFMFWSQAQVNYFLEQNFTKKIKMLKISSEGARL